jgi:hypothetical protein
MNAISNPSKTTLTTATVDPSGCQTVTFSTSSLVLTANPAFWTTLASMLGVQESVIYPYPLAGTNTPFVTTIANLKAESNQVTTVAFSTATALPANPAPNVAATVSVASQAQALYQATLDLSQVPSGTYNCPADLGVTYSLVFSDGSKASPIMQATLDPTGCGWVNINGLGSLVTDATYWAFLASTLGITEAQIYPYPGN